MFIDAFINKENKDTQTNFIPSMLVALMISISIQFLSLQMSKKILIKDS